eukprot:m.491654 g.491654  ORF g.491654 m.491654 type:complete len:449 (-) comp21784_c0_seq48:3734-5080(-)
MVMQCDCGVCDHLLAAALSLCGEMRMCRCAQRACSFSMGSSTRPEHSTHRPIDSRSWMQHELVTNVPIHCPHGTNRTPSSPTPDVSMPAPPDATSQEIDSLADLVRQKVAAREANQVLSVSGSDATNKAAPKKAKWSPYKGGLWGVGTKKAASVHAISVKKPTSALDGKKPLSPEVTSTPASPVSPMQTSELSAAVSPRQQSAPASPASRNWSSAPVSPNRLSVPSSPRSASSRSMQSPTLLQTVDEYLAADAADHHSFEILDDRALEAARWTDKEIRNLIGEIKRLGSPDDQGRSCVDFGVLFEETANMFDALSGLLKTAKKYNVVEFAGEQLWQGRDDRTQIILVADHFHGIKIRRRSTVDLTAISETRKSTRGFDSGFVPGSKCSICDNTVYQTDYVGASGKVFCKKCFRCGGCDKKLSQADYNVSRDGGIRCHKCHTDYERAHF